jgi:hypothetical protein
MPQCSVYCDVFWLNARMMEPLYLGSETMAILGYHSHCNGYEIHWELVCYHGNKCDLVVTTTKGLSVMHRQVLLCSPFEVLKKVLKLKQRAHVEVG